MRLISLNHEKRAKCTTCKCRLAYNPKDLHGGPEQWYVCCPNCGRGIGVEPSKRFLRFRERYLESLKCINQPVDF